MEYKSYDVNEYYNKTLEYQVPYTWRDVALYGLGANARADQLEYINEFSGLTVLPSFPNICCWYSPFHEQPSTDLHESIHPFRLLPLINAPIYGMHGSVTLHKKLNPFGGVMNCVGRITGITDRGNGKGYIVASVIEVTDEKGEALATLTETDSYQWPAQLDVPMAEKPKNILPDRDPDLIVKETTGPAISAIHRLAANKSPAHYSPADAAKKGMGGIYMAGINNQSLACRMLVDTLLPGQADRVTSYGSMLRGHCFNNTPVELQIWKTPEKKAFFRLLNGNDGSRILDQGYICWD